MFSVDKDLAQGGNYSGSQSVHVVEVVVADDGNARLADLAEVGHTVEGIDMVMTGRDCSDIGLEDYTKTGRDLSEFVVALSVPSLIG